MTKNVYAIRDILSGFLGPVIDDNDQKAMRNFAYAVNNSESMMYFRPKDYQLFFLGTFDIDSAKFDLRPVPELVCEGQDMVESKE